MTLLKVNPFKHKVAGLPRQRFSSCCQRWKGDFKQFIHSTDVFHKVFELQAEYIQGMLEDIIKISLACSDQIQLFLYSRSHRGQHQLYVNLQEKNQQNNILDKDTLENMRYQ